MTEDEATLAPFFRAARVEEEAPLPAALLADILADAAAVTAARRPALPARPPQRRWTLRQAFAPVGGWAGAAVLGASAALGFWLGIAGSVSIDAANGTLQAESAWTADWGQPVSGGDDTGQDPVASFYDFAALEG